MVSRAVHRGTVCVPSKHNGTFGLPNWCLRPGNNLRQTKRSELNPDRNRLKLSLLRYSGYVCKLPSPGRCGTDDPGLGAAALLCRGSASEPGVLSTSFRGIHRGVPDVLMHPLWVKAHPRPHTINDRTGRRGQAADISAAGCGRSCGALMQDFAVCFLLFLLLAMQPRSGALL